MFGVQILEKCLLISKITPFVGKILNLVKWLTRSKDSMGGSKVKVKLLNNIRRYLKVTFGTVTTIVLLIRLKNYALISGSHSEMIKIWKSLIVAWASKIILFYFDISVSCICNI